MTPLSERTPGDHLRQAPEPIRPPAGHLAPLLASSDGKFQRVVAQLERFARRGDQPVLLLGESGSGKSIFAEHLHRSSRRADKPFRPVPLASLDEPLAASDLFGHLPGAFSGAQGRRDGAFVATNGGTVFLDEIGKATPGIQAKLLDVVDRKELSPLGADRSNRVDVRIVCATNVPLEPLVLEGKFLPDLLMRLDGFVVRIPPLRERRCDIPPLVRHFIEQLHGDYGYDKAPTVAPELMKALCAREWPGNIRELKKTVARLLVDADGARRITFEHADESLGLRVRSAQRKSREEILAELAGQPKRNVAALARRSGLSRTTIHNSLKCAAAIATTMMTDAAL
jgi:DNA-binding NtrC family response regulator